MKSKYGNETLSIVKSLAIGLIVGLSCVVIVCGILALLITKETVKIELASYGVCAALSLGSAVASWIASIGHKEKILLLSGISGVAYLIMLLCANALFFGGQYRSFWVTAILVIGASMAVGIARFVGKEQSGRRRFRYRKRAIV